MEQPTDVSTQPPENPSEASREPDKEQPLYRVALAPSASTYDPETRQYIPAIPTRLTWPQLIDVVVKRGCTESKDGLGIIPSKITKTLHPKAKKHGFWRLKAGCTTTHLLALDVENYAIGDGTLKAVTDWVRSTFPDTKCLIYTSWNHGNPEKWEPEQPRIRLIIPLKNPVDSHDEYPPLFSWVDDYLDGALDSGCSDPCRISYTYRKQNPEAVVKPWYVVLGGSPLDPERLPDGGSLSALVEAEEERKKALERKRRKRREAIKRGWLSMPDGESKRARKYALKTLEGCAKDIANACTGERHSTIFAKAYRMGTMVASAMINEGTVIGELLDAAKQVLPSERHSDAVRTIQDAIGDAQSNPFDLSELGTVNKRQVAKSLDWDDLLVDADNGLVRLPSEEKNGGAQ